MFFNICVFFVFFVFVCCLLFYFMVFRFFVCFCFCVCPFLFDLSVVCLYLVFISRALCGIIRPCKALPYKARPYKVL